jgi:hypothetical protein
MMGIQSWQNTHNLSVNDTQKILNNKLSELLLTKPAYYVTHEYRNALWGFYFDNNEKNIENNKFLIYHDKRGLSIQVHPKFRKDMIEQLLYELFNTLVDKNNLLDILKDVLKEIL